MTEQERTACKKWMVKHFTFYTKPEDLTEGYVEEFPEWEDEDGNYDEDIYEIASEIFNEKRE